MVFFGVRLIPIVSTNIESQCGFYCVYHWDGHRKTNLAVGLVDPMRRVRDSCGIHRNPQGSSTHWSVCPKATLSKCAAEMGRGTTCWYLLIKQTWQNTDDSRPICFFCREHDLHMVGFCRFTDSSVRCAVFQCSLWGWNLGSHLNPAVHDDFPWWTCYLGW